jgi:hypothetical protein
MAQVLVQITRARSLMFSSLSQDGTLWVSLDCGVSGYNMERLIVDKGEYQYDSSFITTQARLYTSKTDYIQPLQDLLCYCRLSNTQRKSFMHIQDGNKFNDM